MLNKDKPREKLIVNGVSLLTDEELLAVILGSGTKRYPVLMLSKRILDIYQDPKKLYQCGISELCQIEGIGIANACKIKAAIEFGIRVLNSRKRFKKRITRAQEVYQYYSHLNLFDKEVFIILLLDAKSRVLSEKTIALGSSCQCLIDHRDIFEYAIRESAQSIILIHNHPSGDLTPSDEDIHFTRKLKKMGDILGVRVADHLIIGGNNYTTIPC